LHPVGNFFLTRDPKPTGMTQAKLISLFLHIFYFQAASVQRGTPIALTQDKTASAGNC
jgi:hypothetical protein